MDTQTHPPHLMEPGQTLEGLGLKPIGNLHWNQVQAVLLATEALETATYDEFAEQRIAAGRSIMDIFPPADDVLREYREWKKSRG